MFKSLSDFYTSKQWREFRAAVIAERMGNAGGVLFDEWTRQPIANTYDCVLHHKQPLTLANVNDYAISLNPENIMIVTHKSHNEIHSRFGRGRQSVYLVYGSPCSGKTTYVKNNKGNSDIVCDMDSIWECITGERYIKPNALKDNAFILRGALLDMIKTRAGKWERAWIIEGCARIADREKYMNQYGAELIYIDTDKETCLQRLANDTGRRPVFDDWKKYIDNWFNDYQPGE